MIRDHFRRCLEKCPHFSIIDDETNSQGIQILSVCLRLLDFVVDDSKPQKREVLIDIERKTGELIAKAIKESLDNHKCNISDCKAQAYDNTSSMSSDQTGVNAEIQKLAHDADYQGCALHSLNLVIAGACKIPSIMNDGYLQIIVFLFRLFRKTTKFLRNCCSRFVSRFEKDEAKKHVQNKMD